MSKDDFELTTHEEFKKATVTSLMSTLAFSPFPRHTTSTFSSQSTPSPSATPSIPSKTTSRSSPSLRSSPRACTACPSSTTRTRSCMRQTQSLPLPQLCSHLVTQSSVIKFISEHLDVIGVKKNMKIHQMEAGLQYVVSVLEEERAIDAFKTLKVCVRGYPSPSLPSPSPERERSGCGRRSGPSHGRALWPRHQERRLHWPLGLPPLPPCTTSSLANTLILTFSFQVSKFIHNKPIYVRADDTLADAIRKVLPLSFNLSLRFSSSHLVR